MGVGLDLRGRRRDGSTFPVEISPSPWAADLGDVRVICTVRDVTEYKRLRNFSEGALQATEEERRRIARELHDDTAQRLATLVLRVRRLADERDPRTRIRLHEEIRQEIVDAADGVKRLARGLRPPEIEELGLALAIAAHVRSLREAARFDVKTELDAVDHVLNMTAKLSLYRIVQEALSNARRYSGTSQATVRLFLQDGTVVAVVSDRGRGFLPSQVPESGGGLGLVGMKERAAMLGGRLTIDSAPGEGTTVRVTVPAVQWEKADG
jgi:two-component system sensor histidine kinase UhpB